MNNNFMEIVEDVHQVNLTMRERMDVTNGILDRERLTEGKQKLMKFAMDYLKDELIEVKQEFVDSGGQSVIELSIDAVVMRGEEYRRLVKILEKI